ncbi:protein piccolo [Rhopalosiphum maidis]|uniref:protein piccolo n=1 Tax=Rhopalosiphum maidis TaxID=43146 RepID=UPI000EFEA294|nr:protein piccolo [Rhopalosiphum maidis]
MKGWGLVVLLCTALLSEPVRPEEKWSRPETAAKRVDDWVPITASCPSCQKNLESSDEAGGVDEVGRLLNPPAVPSGRAFNFNSKQNNFNRAPTGEPYEITTPAATSAQFFGQQQAPKIPQPVHFPVPFFGQQNPFSGRFQGLPNFQPQFTFIPQPQIQSAPKENKVTFPESPFIQQQNKGSVQLVYVPIEALQRQKPRLQADRPIPQQSQIDAKTQSPFETGKLKFQRPPQPFEPQFPLPQQFEQEPNRFAPPPPTPPSFEQNTGRFPPPSQLFEQGKPNFSNQLKEQRPEFLPQNEQPVSPQSFQFLEDARNPPSNFFQFHDNRFQKPAFEDKPKETKPQGQQTFTPNLEESRQESAQNFVSNFDGSRPRPGPQPQNFQQNFEETRPRQEPRPQSAQPNFQETRPKQELPPTKFVPKFEEPKLEPEQQFVPNFQETTRPRQESPPPPPPPQFVPKFEEPKLQSQPQFIPNFQETTRPRQEPPPQQFVPNFEEPKLEPQQQFVPNFQENRPRQELPPPPQQFVPNFEEPKLEPQQQFVTNFQEIPQVIAQQTFTPNFESLRPKPEIQPNTVHNFQDTRPKQEPQAPFVPNFEEVKQKSKPKVQLSQSSTLTPQLSFNSQSPTEKAVQTPSTPYPPPHQPPLSVYMEKRLDNKINEVLTILKDAKTIPVLDTIGNRSPKVFVGPSDLDAPRGYVKFALPYLSSLDITKIDSMIDRLPFFVAPLNFKPPPGYAKIPFPPPHIGSVVVSSKSPVVSSSTEFNPFKLTSQLPTEVNSLQPSISSTTQRGTERAQPITDATPSTPKRSRQRKPLHRGSLTSFSTTTPLNDITERQKDQFTTPAELQKLPEISTLESEKPQFLESTPTSIRQKFTRKPVEQQQTVFETTQAPIFDNTQKQQFESTQQQQFDNIQQQQFENTQQQQSDHTQSQQFFADQQVPHNQQNYLDTLSSWPQQEQQQQFFNNQQPSQQPFFENHQQLLDNPSQTSPEQFLNNPQSPTDLNNPEINQQQFISSSTEKQIFKNFQQIQPLSQYQVGNNFLNQQQSSTEQVQSASNPPQTVSEEPLTAATLSPTDTPKLRQRLSYYDKLLLTSTQVPVEIPSTQNIIESSEKPKERTKLRPRQRLTTTKRPTTESSSISEEVSEQITETSTQRYNPLKRRRPVTTTTTETTETTRNPLRSRTTQASRSEFVRSRSSRRPTTTTTTTTTSTTEAAPVQQQFQDEAQPTSQQDEQKKIEEAASFWNEPVTVQQSHGYELDTRYTQAPSGPDSKFSSGEPPADEDLSKEKHYHGSGNDKKAHDPNVEKKTPGRRGHWVRVRVKKPQDNLDTAESQNSLGPLSANAIHELVTKPTTEFEVSSSSAPEELSTTTTTTTIAPTTITASATTDSNQKQLLVTTISDNAEVAVTTTEEERPAETTQTPEVSPPVAKYPDDEQDEAFQRNLADMLAKFISGGDEPRAETATVSAEESTVDLVAETESTDPTIVTAAAVTELPLAPVTSTTTKVSMETEICYKGRCVKSKKNKQITDLVSEP